MKDISNEPHLQSRQQKSAILTRRKLLQQSALMGVTAMSLPLLSGFAIPKSKAATTVATTQAGQVRGVVNDGVHTFKGIPYGASVGDDARFMCAHVPSPWSGVRNAIDYGPISYQPPGNITAIRSIFKSDDPLSRAWRALNGEMAEGQLNGSIYEGDNCLVLNVWTPALQAGQKKPVMVWLHGGGYRQGWGTSQGEGDHLARSEDVVVVSLNHRLGVFGHLYLAELGDERYRDSGNVGMLDIVLALEWIRDNIAEFGGDPGNITIFGESGGGSKVNVLMAMPAAKGLFHRAISQSSGTRRLHTTDTATEYAERLLYNLDLKPKQIDQLHRLSARQILAGANADGSGMMGVTPVVDGGALPTDPFDPASPASAIYAGVPLMIGSNEYELTDMPHVAEGIGADHPYLRTGSLPEGMLHKEITSFLKNSPLSFRKGKSVDMSYVDELVKTHRMHYPGASDFETYYWIISAKFRLGAINIAERKAKLQRAPTFMYLFAYQTPAFGGHLLSGHEIEVPFVFSNHETVARLTENDPHAISLSQKMSKAWANFARTGNPGHAALPDWPAYGVPERKTMIFDRNCKLATDPDGEELRAM